VKTWDVIVIGGGVIGLSLSIELRKKGASVLVVERGAPGREASHAAGGLPV
jgi:glycine/D-amino acid oxidase-like deaminating enzyme